MQKQWLCRDYHDGDEHFILPLFRDVFGRELDLRVWTWRFKQNPCGPAVVKLLFDQGRLIGHYAVIPMLAQVKSQPRRAALSMTTMTHPDYGGRGVFSFLAEETYEKCMEDGLSFVFGFPNGNSYHGFTHRLGWQGRGNMSVWEKPIRGCHETLVDDGYTTVRIRTFDLSADLLWENVRDRYAVAVQRKKEFLNWRFIQNPTTTYDVYVVPADTHRILGYVVLKRYEDGPIRRGHIVDIVSVDDESVLRALLRRSYVWSHASDADVISCWVPENTPCGSLMRRVGFVKREAETFFGFKTLDPADQLNDIPFADWFLTMADSDVF